MRNRIKILSFFGMIIVLCFILFYKKTKTSPYIKTPIITKQVVQNAIQGDTIITTLFGSVVDEKNNPVNHAVVIKGTDTTYTNQYGKFVFENTLCNATLTYIKVIHKGYFNGSRSLETTPNNVHSLSIMMMRNDTQQTFEASKKTILTIDQDITLTFPSNAITHPDGTPYDGKVTIAARYLNPDSEKIKNLMPGTLWGITDAGKLRGLLTYGMIMAELAGEQEEPLQIKKGEYVELAVPAPEHAPDTMPMWHFDEQYGIWVAEGMATKRGDKYHGWVSHFSVWNMDIDFDNQAILTLHVVNQLEENMQGIEASIKPTAGSSVFTDRKGLIDMKRLPANRDIMATFYLPDGTRVIKNVGNANTTRTQKVVLNIPYLKKIKGRVMDCKGKPVKDKFFYFILTDTLENHPAQIIYNLTDHKGFFSIHMSVDPDKHYKSQLLINQKSLNIPLQPNKKVIKLKNILLCDSSLLLTQRTSGNSYDQLLPGVLLERKKIKYKHTNFSLKFEMEMDSSVYQYYCYKSIYQAIDSVYEGEELPANKEEIYTIFIDSCSGHNLMLIEGLRFDSVIFILFIDVNQQKRCISDKLQEKSLSIERKKRGIKVLQTLRQVDSLDRLWILTSSEADKKQFLKQQRILLASIKITSENRR